MKVNVKRAVSRLNNNVPFLQPVYEAISNSLEANATYICVEFLPDNLQNAFDIKEKLSYRINGFTITDNGDGFTEINIESFKELWTDAKKNLGCKGIGRLTWLKVFQNISIYSRLKNKEVSIKFTEDFDDDRDITLTNGLKNTNETYTQITFSNVSTTFFTKNSNKEIIDNREKADLEKLYIEVKKHLLIKLALLKKRKISFEIKLVLENEERYIDFNNIPELCEDPFIIEDYNKNNQEFILFYNISNDGLNQKDLFYCANGRTVNRFPENISLEKIKNQDSIIMLLTSNYLDERVNDERNAFLIDKLQNNENLTDPLSFPRINEKLKQHVEDILIQKYPDIIKENEKEIEKAIKEVPYLSSYIRSDNSLIKNKTNLINNAKKSFEKEKENTTTLFSRLLSQKNIDTNIFEQSIKQISKVALEELGEYVLYRQQIISGLKKALSDKTKKEKYIHDIIMQMHLVVDNDLPEEDKYFFSNFWLFDDKFMTYSYAASDKTMKQISQDINNSYTQIYKGQDRPDLAIFYNKNNTQKDVIVCELKGVHASIDEKNKSLIELPNNINTIRRNIPECNRIWGYIITSIDADFEASIKNTDKFQPLFSNYPNGKAYYGYYKNLDTHITIVDLETIITDAEARNNVFLNILSKSRKSKESND